MNFKDFIYDLVFNKTTIFILFLLSLILSVILFFCNREASSSFLAAAASFMAAALTLQIARSADQTSKESLKMSENLINIEIIKEGPMVYISNQTLMPSGSDNRNIILVNYGESPAINIECDLFVNNNNRQPLFVYQNEPGRPVIERAFGIDGDKLPKDNEALNYVITYENFFGKKFKNEFSLVESNEHEGNINITRRVSVYTIKNQRVSLE